MSRNVTCPSGLIGVVRGLKGREAKLLSDKDVQKNGRLVDEILAACWVETTDPGPYTIPPGGRPAWEGEVLGGDKLYALVEIRKATFGDQYGFSIQCENSGCREKFDWELKLSDLPVQALSPDDRQKFKEGNRFTTTFPHSTTKVVFKLPTGADAKRAQSLFKGGGDAILNALSLRIVEIEGVPLNERRRWLEDQSLGDLNALMHQLDAVDCGIDTDIEVDCPSCQTRMEVRLPFGRDFFLPKEKKSTPAPE